MSWNSRSRRTDFTRHCLTQACGSLQFWWASGVIGWLSRKSSTSQMRENFSRPSVSSDFDFHVELLHENFQPPFFHQFSSSLLLTPAATECWSLFSSQLRWERWVASILEWRWTRWICLQTMPDHWWQPLTASELWQEFWGKFSDKLDPKHDFIALFLFRPYLVGALTGDQSVNSWRIVFWIAFGVFNVTNVVYIIWASGEVQPWNDGYQVKNIGDDANSDSYEPQNTQIEKLKGDSLK